MPVLMCQPRFVPDIRAGIKIHTIRPHRKRPIYPLDSLSLRQWRGAPYRSKQKEVLATECEAVVPIVITVDGPVVAGRPANPSTLARLDGFPDWHAMRQWFENTHGLPFEGDLIEWTPPPVATISENGDGRPSPPAIVDPGKPPRISPDTRYPGGKGLPGVPEWIISHMRPHAFYAEPFAGKGAVFRRKPPALRSYLIDEDPAVGQWWRRLAPPGAIVTCGDGIRWLELAAEWLGDDALIYVDPPYRIAARSKKRIYRRELTKNDHARILDAICRARCDVIISGYPTEQYDNRLADWHRVTRQVITRGAVLRTEVLWLNYEPTQASPSLAMKYSALGDDFRERERVNRKIKRWQNNLQAMPPAERRMMLLGLLQSSIDHRHA